MTRRAVFLDRDGTLIEERVYVSRVADVTRAHELGGVGVLVRTGYGEEEAARVPPGTVVVEDLVEAVRLILSGA